MLFIMINLSSDKMFYPRDCSGPSRYENANTFTNFEFKIQRILYKIKLNRLSKKKRMPTEMSLFRE